MSGARSNTRKVLFIGLKKAINKLSFFKPFFIFSLSLFFFINSIGGDLLLCDSWAAKAAPGLPSVGPEDAGGPSPLKVLNADTFTIPQELGYVQEAIQVPGAERTVIHIQDAHCNYAAQRQISEILGYLISEYGIDYVNCEGGEGKSDLTVFTAINEKDVREKVSDFFVRQGVVNAAEYFAVNNPAKAKLWGVEDAGLYIENLKVYRESLAYKDEVDRYIKSLFHILGNLKSRIYSPGLLDFDGYYMKHKDGQVSFKEYVIYLIATAEKRSVDIKSFPNLYLLARTLKEEDAINFRKANNEKDEIVEKLKKVLSKKELEDLVEKVAQMKLEKISQPTFYSYLIKKCRSVKMDIKDYPELNKYIIYISIYGGVDKTKISKEMEMLEEKIKDSLYENDTQRELGLLSKNLVLEKNIFNISLTREDYIYYKEHRQSFDVSNFVRFIDRYAPIYKIQARLDENISRLDVYREKIEAFYECSLKRDKAFVKNIKFTDHDRPNSIIITGGFHTENLRELFKNEKVSYVSILPKFTNEKGYDSPYLKRLAGQRTALENVIDTAIPAVLNLQVVNILSTELALKVEGKENLEKFRLAVSIMAVLMKSPNFILKVKGGAIQGREDEKEKFITFTRTEGAEGIKSSVSATSAAGYNAEVTLVTSDVFEYNENMSPATGAPVEEAVPPLVPRADKLAQPAVPSQPVVTGPATTVPALTDAELLYKNAISPAMGAAGVVRRNTATRIVSAVAFEEDKTVVAGLNQAARKLMGPDIHINSYVASDNWMPELKKMLEIELREFVENDFAKLNPLMEIKIGEGKDTRQNVERMIDDILIAQNYKDRIKEIKDRIRLVQIRIDPGKRTNPAVEFFADISMLECDRYINGDYGETKEDRTPPLELQSNFLALLNLSIKNGKDFEGKNIDEVLRMIFSGHLLEIRPVDFNTFDQWNRANRQLMQSV